MQFRADEYYQCGLERMEQARRIHRLGGAFALAVYCGGLAVECMLRAFRWKEEATFQGRHDLTDLLRASRLLSIDDEYMRRRGASDEEIRQSGLTLRAAMQEVIELWNNNIRFASEDSLRAHLKRSGRLRGIRGDPLKKNANNLLEAAQTIINRGTALWTSRRK